MNFLLPDCEPAPELAELLPQDMPADLRSAAATAWTHAPFLKGLMPSRRALLQQLVAAGPAAVMATAHALLGDSTSEQSLASRLRRARGDVALLVALADLSGRWPLELVTAALSDFADAAIDAAIAAALAERGAPNRGLVALALGKLGSRELNYSSDVDLILLHEPALIPCRSHEEPEEAAVRIARRAVALLADRMPDGYVARVDLRLRPSSEITPISMTLAAAEYYYQSEAETWERLAFVRSRAVGGDVALGEAFLRRLQPFVWRRSVDFTAVRDVQSVSLRIRDHFEGGQALGPGFDIKRGRGGIREVEFFTQINQLIWGGRDTSLRVPATLEALQALLAAGRIEPGEAEALATSYRAFRTIEHRLQMRRDEQTHMVPKLAADRAGVAALCGAKDWDVVERALARLTAPVARAYDELIAAATPPATPVPADAAPWLKAEYPKLAKTLGPLMERWRGTGLRALRSESARAAFERILPGLIAGIAEAADPARAAVRLDGFLEQLPPAAQFLALLEANPRLVELLSHLLGVAPVLADALARTPALFDVMLGPDAVEPPPLADALAAELVRMVGNSVSLEEALDRVRRWTSERRFQLGAQLIEGHVAPLVAARALAGLADAALQVLMPAVTAGLAEAHGHVPGAEPLVLAMGRYGGGMLTHASDLDLVFLYEGDPAALSNGTKPIAAHLWFNRLGARLSTALSVPTAEGGLYEVDTRLRPWGTKGPLFVNLESYARYQAEDAEAWEHMALTRTRLIGGSPATRAKAEAVVRAQLAKPRDADALRKAVVGMRADIAKAKPGQGVFDVKLGPGGLVDLEFIIHYLQLLTPEALTPDMHLALDRLAAAGKLPAAQAEALAAAHDLLASWLVMLRLVVPGMKLPESFSPAVEAVLVRSLGAASYTDAMAALGLAKQHVRLAWETILQP